MIKRKDLSKFLHKAHDIRDLGIQSRLNKFSEKYDFFNRGDNNNFFLPNPPPPPLGPPPPPLPSDLFNIPNVPRIDEFLNNSDFEFDFSNGYVPPAPDPLPPRGLAGNFFPNRPSTAKTSLNMETNMTQTMSVDCLIGERERVIEKEKPKEEIVSDENIILTLPKAPTILDDEDFETKQEIKKRKDDKIQQERDLMKLKDKIDKGEIPREIEFYFGAENYNFFLMCLQLGLNKDNENFMDFLSSDIGSQIFRKNMLSIHIETRNISYDNCNTNESIYSFLLN